MEQKNTKLQYTYRFLLLAIQVDDVQIELIFNKQRLN